MNKKISPLGLHASVAGGISKAIEQSLLLGCDAVQIFARNPRAWRSKEIDTKEVELFRQKRIDSGIWPLVTHTSYLINLATPDKELYEKSIQALIEELMIARLIGADYVVTHPGSHRDSGLHSGIKRTAKAIKTVIDAAGSSKKNSPLPLPMILIENTAGGGTQIGGNLANLKAIIELTETNKVGVCFDTCHGFAAGYAIKKANIKSLLTEMNKELPLKHIKVIHLNDSKGDFGSAVDRHEHIGKGKIGGPSIEAFITHPKIKGTPLILETPKDTEEDDKRNLARVNKMRRSR